LSIRPCSRGDGESLSAETKARVCGRMEIAHMASSTDLIEILVTYDCGELDEVSLAYAISMRQPDSTAGAQAGKSAKLC
jgi:hypothetical protein